MQLPLVPIRYLAAGDVRAAMPPIEESLELADLTMRALAGPAEPAAGAAAAGPGQAGAELPPKIGVHPRQAGSLAHAMPALLRGGSDDGSGDLLGVKWIAGFPDNLGAGLPAYHALVLLNDPRTGVPLAILDGGPITAERTAAISAVAIRRLAPFRIREGAAAVAVLGAGVQARSHLRGIGHVLPGARVRLVDRDASRAATLAEETAAIEGIASATAVGSAREAVEGAHVVVSAVSFGPDRQALDRGWLKEEVLFIAVDYDMMAPAILAHESFFVVDERDQFLATRSGPVFAGYPEPDTTIGALLRNADAPPAGRPILVSHLGVGLADIVFASAVWRRAVDLGLGVALPR